MSFVICLTIFVSSANRNVLDRVVSGMSNLCRSQRVVAPKQIPAGCQRLLYDSPILFHLLLLFALDSTGILRSSLRFMDECHSHVI